LKDIFLVDNFNMNEWFSKMKKENFFFLHSPTGDIVFDSIWIPLILKLIKLVLNSSSGKLINSLQTIVLLESLQQM
jgi:hypothetical protein